MFPIMGSPRKFSFFLLVFFLVVAPFSSAQTTASAPAPAPASLSPSDACNGVFLQYDSVRDFRIKPILPSDPSHQPFHFEGRITVLNGDTVPLQAWSVHLDFPNGTVIVSADTAVIASGGDFPYIVGLNGSAGVSFVGTANPDLKTSIETAGDLNQIQAVINIIGTRFGVSPPASYLPSGLTLDNPQYICPPLQSPKINETTFLNNDSYTCCTRDPKFKSNGTSSFSDHFPNRRSGDLSISYDVIQSYEGSYLAQVKIENQSPLGRLDGWRLKWDWHRGEFILRTQGATTTVTDFGPCLFGPQGQFYKALDFSTVQNCDRTPTFLDLPMSLTNDPKLGSIPFCCRNGTILPDTFDPARSTSAFQLHVYKMPPDLNRTKLYPPQNWKISGSSDLLNPNYVCGPPLQVSPSLFPDPGGLPTSSAAVASWQVVCNITRASNANPRCCVSFSGFYNDSVVPCKTCACGCPSSVGRTCSTTSPALLLPPDALLVPFDNRTDKALAWAQIKHFNVPNPMPCGDYCGVSINWHVYTDYTNGWTARMTLFNWENVDIPDWFAAVVMDKAYNGYEALYSFNGSALGNDTIFMKGLPYFNYLVKESPGTSRDPSLPGKLQSVISFTKKLTPGIDVVSGDGFPSKVFFNGEECSIPNIFPRNSGFRTAMTGGSFLSLCLVLVVSVLMLLEL